MILEFKLNAATNGKILIFNPPAEFNLEPQPAKSRSTPGEHATITAKMTSRPTVTIHGADGKPGNDTHTLPAVFKAPIRPDIVQYD